MRVLLLNSGGLDSALLGKKLFDEGHEVFSLFIDFKLVNSEKARAAARETASRYAKYHQEIELDLGMTPNYTEDGLEMSVPATLKLVISIGQSLAKILECEECYCGAKGWITRDFEAAWENVDLQNPHPVVRAIVRTPMWKLNTYPEVAEWAGADIKDFAYTVSCRREGNDDCEKCRQRKDLF